MIPNFNFLITAQNMLASEEHDDDPPTARQVNYASACALVAIAQELKRHNDRIEADADREERLAEYRARKGYGS